MVPGRSIVIAGLACLAAQSATAVEVHECAVLVIGGSAGGVAAAVAAQRLGVQACLVESTPWLGGQFLTVPALDEPPIPDPPPPDPPFPRSRPFSASYRALRKYLQDQTVSEFGYELSCPPIGTHEFEDFYDPGKHTTGTGIGYPPHFARDYIEELIADDTYGPMIDVLRNARVTGKRLSADGTTITGAYAVADSVTHEFHATVTIDATEFGDFLVLPPALRYRVGVDARDDTTEPHAAQTANPICVNPLTYTFFLESDFSSCFQKIDKPANYDSTLAPLYTVRGTQPFRYPEPTCPPQPLGMTFWNWRRTFWPAQSSGVGRPEQTQVNWAGHRLPVPGDPAPNHPTRGGNDFNRNCYGNTYAGCEAIEGADRAQKLGAAQELARGFAYFLQTNVAPNTNCGVFQTRWRMAGAETAATFPPAPADGFAPIPYVRESRRIRAVKTILEQDISRDQNLVGGAPPPRAPLFPDSVGIGLYHMDTHDCAPGEPFLLPDGTFGPESATVPFQIPLGAMVPIDGQSQGGTEGFLASSKNIGTTHLTNGAYRLHHGEWQIGLASGVAAARAALDHVSVRDMVTNFEPQFGVTSRPHVQKLRTVQQSLVKTLRSPIYWWGDVWDAYDDSPPEVARLFEATQMVAADGIMTGTGQGMNFKPGDPVMRQDGAVIIMRTIHKLLEAQCTVPAFLDVGCAQPNPQPNYKYIKALKDAGALITTRNATCDGVPITSDYFRPGCNILRRDWTRFLVLAMGLQPVASPAQWYSDVPTANSDIGYIERARLNGLVDVTSGAFRSNCPLTRAEAALMAYNAMRTYYGLPGVVTPVAGGGQDCPVQ